MSLPILALFTRSLRVESRQLTLYLGRLALLVVIGFYLLVFQSESRFYSAPGLMFFESVVMINLVFITLAGLSYFASAITEEKEEMTLGLLRMTRLNPVSILLGKSTARMIGALLLLAVQFPFTLLAVTLGGVGPHQIVAAYATLLAYVVFVSGLALCCSVVASRTSGAAWLAGILLAGFLFVPPIGQAVLAGLTHASKLDPSSALYRTLAFVFEWAGNASPFSRAEEISRTGFSAFPVGWQVVSNVLAGALFFLAAWAGFDRFTRQQKEASPARGLLAKSKSRFRIFSPGRAWRNALAWKDFNFIAGGWTMVLIKFVVYGAALAGIYAAVRDGGRMTIQDYCLGVRYFMGSVLIIELAWIASRAFNEEMKWQTLAGVVLLPVSIRSLAYRKVAGCLLGLIPSATYTLLAAYLSIGAQGGPSGNDWFLIHFIYFAVAVFFVHLAVYLSLVLKHGAIAAALAICFVGLMVMTFLFQFLFILFRFQGNDGEEVILFAGGAIALVIAAILNLRIGRRIAKVAARE
ncbi:MAG: ABC transporter permease [Candidatus Brocadiia bacterium]